MFELDVGVVAAAGMLAALFIKTGFDGKASAPSWTAAPPSATPSLGAADPAPFDTVRAQAGQPSRHKRRSTMVHSKSGVASAGQCTSTPTCNRLMMSASLSG